MYKSYIFRLYPNIKQEELINKTIGCSRLIYNYFLDLKQKEYQENKKTRSTYDWCKEIPVLIKEKYHFLSEVDSCALRSAIFDMEDAYNRFFKKQNNFPKFKKKFKKESYRTSNVSGSYKGKEYNSIEVDMKNKIIKLPKLKEVKIRGYRNLENLPGKIINATIRKDGSRRYYVSVLVEEAVIKVINHKQRAIGLDLGIKELVTTSEGESFCNQKSIQKYEKRIKHLQRELTRKVVRSNNWRKCKNKLATLYRKLRNTRQYYLHQISKKITDTYKVIVTETLAIKNMLQNHKLAKAITDVSWYELIRQLEYKSRNKDCIFIQVDKSYASSQECSYCGVKNKAVKDLRVRKWECGCGAKHDRDINAAINILWEGISKKLVNIKI